jgi:hypothetical protein
MGVSDALTDLRPRGGWAGLMPPEYETLIVCTRYVPNMYRIEIDDMFEYILTLGVNQSPC